MNYVLPIVLFLGLGVIAALHALWAIGSTWPASDEMTLAKLVVGNPEHPRMPPKQYIWVVAAALALAACDALALAFKIQPLIDQAATYIGAGLVAVFLCRGIAGYTPPWRDAHPDPAFTLADKRLYSPVCILIAEGFFTMVTDRF